MVSYLHRSIILVAVLTISTKLVYAQLTLEECTSLYGPVPTDETCTGFPNIGDGQFLAVDPPPPDLNTEVVAPPEIDINANYNPVFDAFCFNEDYPVPTLTKVQHEAMYLDYKQIFDRVLVPPVDGEGSLNNNGVTNERIPGLFLRMCFHDNAVEPNMEDFATYVANSIDSSNNNTWIGEKIYMPTSGADASVLICPEERLFPNQNYDQTASRVLRSIQTTMKPKYKNISYADFLHNGCNAALIYLSGKGSFYKKSLVNNPFTFGRKDACHADKICSRKYPLCGPSLKLPGVGLGVHETIDWFASRGMSECLFMALMWTHTTMDNMASLCPIARLTCLTSNATVDTFTDKTKIYFTAGRNLDYFTFFLYRGMHAVTPTVDPGAPMCDWRLGRTTRTPPTPWPMTAIDCTLGVDNVDRANAVGLATVIRKFALKNPSYNRFNFLMCALNILGGKSGEVRGLCNSIAPTECKAPSAHKFGGYYSTLPPTITPRVIVDPQCEIFGF
jgi:Peroxidase